MTRRTRPNKYWVSKAFSKNKGALHRDLGVAPGKPIPASKERAAAKRGGVVGRRARLALTARKFRHR